MDKMDMILLREKVDKLLEEFFNNPEECISDELDHKFIINENTQIVINIELFNRPNQDYTSINILGLIN